VRVARASRPWLSCAGTIRASWGQYRPR